ncbi:hypothetical protein H5119_14475 [Pseudoalteromonas sp. SG45-5]|uniref:hypothetical protein n=1 Tax=unclassified Pseudoalteromonas TaxID=194690 RepID=UPI0015FAE20F|nr:MULTISPECIES: hypothetical protein [unclassified Pseudoalteromonas]MBB1386730.1 hypothetical protein [Pseudoalteromonas sp. SG45-5]MBB1394731.1 hypothetical protein [Pseudoalteromonas sp. SG44-4]MBB1449186.1 hypothetical protein [Pseudoalteromonas sp. SG41-6]
MNIKKLLTAAVVLTACVSFNTKAYYEHYIESWQATGTLSVAGYTKSLTHDEFVKVTNRSKSIRGIEDTLKAYVKGEVKRAIAGKASLQNYDLKFNGPFKVLLQGQPDGRIKVKLGGFSFSTNAKIKKSFYVKGNIKIWSNTLNITGYYNPYTGTIGNATVDPNFKVSSDIDIDSILDLIPLFNSIVTNKIEDKLKHMVNNTAIELLNEKVINYQEVIFGLDKAIPSGKYIFNGRDYAQVIKDKFITLTNGEFISIDLDRTKKVLFGSRTPYYIGSMNLNISNSVKLTIIDTPVISERCDYSNPNSCSI